MRVQGTGRMLGQALGRASLRSHRQSALNEPCHGESHIAPLEHKEASTLEFSWGLNMTLVLHAGTTCYPAGHISGALPQRYCALSRECLDYTASHHAISN